MSRHDDIPPEVAYEHYKGLVEKSLARVNRIFGADIPQNAGDLMMANLGKRLTADEALIRTKREQADEMERDARKLRQEADEIERLLELARRA